MKTSFIRNIGIVVHLEDYVRITKSSNSFIIFERVDHNKKDYNKRQISILLDKNNNIVVTTAVSPSNKKLKNKTISYHIAQNRLNDFLEKDYQIDATDKGVVWVPESFIDLLYTDESTFANIYGPLAKDTLKNVVTFLKKRNKKQIKKEISACYAQRRFHDRESSKNNSRKSGR